MIKRWRPLSWRSTDPDRTPVRLWIVTRRWVAPRSDTTREATCASTAELGADDASDFARRPVRRRDRSQTPPSVAWRWDRVRTYTTGLRPERAALRRPDTRTRCALGCARSSRQTMATLGTACFQHCPPCTVAHAVTEAVLLGTTSVVGLVGALHAALLAPRSMTGLVADR